MQWQYRYGGVFVVRTHDGRHSEETGYRPQPGAAGCAGFIMNGRPSDARQKARITAAWALPYVAGKWDRLPGLLCLSNVQVKLHQLLKGPHTRSLPVEAEAAQPARRTMPESVILFSTDPGCGERKYSAQ